MEPSTNPKAIASLVLGILSLICALGSWTPLMRATSIMGTFILGIVMAVVGLILGIAANKEAKSGIGTTGIVLSAVSLGLYVLFLAACGLALMSCLSVLRSLSGLSA